MKTLRLFWVLFAVAIIFGLSVYLSSKKLNELKTDTKTSKVIVVDTPTPESPQQPAVASDNVDKGVPMNVPGCVESAQFTNLKKELGKIVNNRELRESKRQDFLKQINDFRLQKGLPLPMSVATAKLVLEGAVFNNCRSTCRGSVHEVFVSQVDGARFVNVLQKDETIKKLPLHESGVEMASIDELNKKGVPFRSWLAPVSDNDWYIKGSDLYYSLNIEGLWLKIDTSSHWEVVVDPIDLTKLRDVEEPLSVRGCNNEERCLEGGSRHFKAPRICHN